MNSFYDSPSAQQSALMVFVFLALLLCLCNAFALPYHRKAKGLYFLNAGIFCVLFALDALMGQAFWELQSGKPYREILPLPLWCIWCIAATMFALLVWESIRLLLSLRQKKQALRRDSIKQAMDTLPSAICYFTPDGAVKLCNLQMHRLYRALAQRDLQTLAELHRALDGCDRKSGIIKLSDELQTYLFPNGKAWRYSETVLTASDGVAYTEASFTDVTELYEDSLKLSAQTKHLQQIARDLQLLSFNVQTAAKEQQILSAKTTLHDQMGAGVLAVRRILQSGKTEEAVHAVELFRKAVSMIKSDNASPSGRNELTEFLHDADTIGVKVFLSGSLPHEEALSHTFILAMRECLTNGVRHAGASEMKMRITQSESAAALQITNNGTVPKSPITAKGGLLNLSHTVVNLGGTMEIQSSPIFMLTVTIPFTKEGA